MFEIWKEKQRKQNWSDPKSVIKGEHTQLSLIGLGAHLSFDIRSGIVFFCAFTARWYGGEALFRLFCSLHENLLSWRGKR